MDEEHFPKSLCHICSKPVGLNDGAIYCGDYATYIVKLSRRFNNQEELLRSDYAEFVRGVTGQYFKQFPELQPNSIKKLFLNVLAHDICIPDEFRNTCPHHTVFDKVGTYENAERWTAHLRGKNWLNPEGWNIILDDLSDKFKGIHIPV